MILFIYFCDAFKSWITDTLPSTVPLIFLLAEMAAISLSYVARTDRFVPKLKNVMQVALPSEVFINPNTFEVGHAGDISVIVSCAIFLFSMLAGSKSRVDFFRFEGLKLPSEVPKDNLAFPACMAVLLIFIPDGRRKEKNGDSVWAEMRCRRSRNRQCFVAWSSLKRSANEEV